MVDYGRIAEETKQKLDAASFAAEQKVKHAVASEVFFNGIETALGKEIIKANPELDRHGLLVGHKTAGIAIVPKLFGSQIRLSYGRTAVCEVNFDQTNSMIQVEMSGEPNAKGEMIPQTLTFRLSSNASGAVARKMEIGMETPGDFGPAEIAEIVTEGMIRGYFA